jgi:type II secretory pathway pseudopilin PulG
MEGIKMGDHSHSEGCKALDLAYQRAGESYEAITEFRGKLLALLPLATGTAAFLLLERVQAAQAQAAQAQAAQAQAAQAQAAQAQAAQAQAHAHQLQQFLGPIGIFGVVVTLGLFTYELRGMQRCHRLEVQAGALEKQLGLSAEQGPFLGQPQRALTIFNSGGYRVWSADAW